MSNGEKKETKRSIISYYIIRITFSSKMENDDIAEGTKGKIEIRMERTMRYKEGKR